MVYFSLEAKSGPGVMPSWTDSKDGTTKAMKRLFRFKNKVDENFVRVLSKDGKGGQNDLDKGRNCHFYTRGGLPTGVWRSMGWACHPRPNAVLTKLKQVFSLEKHDVVAKYKEQLNIET